MLRITLDAEAVRKLTAHHHAVEVADETGRVVGRFVPWPDASEYDLEPEVSEDELRRRLRETGGRTLSAIMTDLQK